MFLFSSWEVRLPSYLNYSAINTSKSPGMSFYC